MTNAYDRDGNKDIRLTYEREIDDDLRVGVVVACTRSMSECTPDNMHERLVGALDFLVAQFAEEDTCVPEALQHFYLDSLSSCRRPLPPEPSE